MQFAVQALIPDLESAPGSGIPRDEWRDVYTTPWTFLDKELIAQCRTVAMSAERFYVSVRVVQRNDDDSIKIISR